MTVHGELAEAEQRRALLAAQAEQLRERRPPLRSVAELLEVWIAARHDWKPSTGGGYRQAARRLSLTPLAGRRPDAVSPPVLRAAMRDWSQAGTPASMVALHARTLKAALGWAFAERLIASQPLVGLRGPAQPAPRRDVRVQVVRVLLLAAEREVAAASEHVRDLRDWHRLHAAEQVELLLRLAADTAARRGEHDQPGVCLHRLRHTVTTSLVADGQLLQAQQRLRHADASTTLRQYCHALPLRDVDVADHLDALYR